MNINKTFFGLIQEQNILKTTKTKPIVDAIKDRHPVTFYYSGPRKPKKNSVKAGNRVEGEAVALGLNKKGNLVVRMYVQPPSTSKKGFEEHGWRTFLINRMSNVQVLNDKEFSTKRPLYKEGDDGSMTVTYVTSDWTKTPEAPKPDTPPTVEPTKPEVTPIKKPEVKREKPSKTPDMTQKKATDYSTNIFNTLRNKVKDVDGEKTLLQQDFDNSIKDLYRKKEEEWKVNQQSNGGNTNPGQGTRSRFDFESKNELNDLLSKSNIKVGGENKQELPQPKTKDKPPVDPNNDNLQEIIKKFKSLICN